MRGRRAHIRQRVASWVNRQRNGKKGASRAGTLPDLPVLTPVPHGRKKTGLAVYTSSRKDAVDTVNRAGKYHVGLLKHIAKAEWDAMSEEERWSYIKDAEEFEKSRPDNEESAVADQCVTRRAM